MYERNDTCKYTQTKKKPPIFMVTNLSIQLRWCNKNETKIVIKRPTNKNGDYLILSSDLEGLLNLMCTQLFPLSPESLSSKRDTFYVKAIKTLVLFAKLSNLKVNSSKKRAIWINCKKFSGETFNHRLKLMCTQLFPLSPESLSSKRDTFYVKWQPEASDDEKNI